VIKVDAAKLTCSELSKGYCNDVFVVEQENEEALVKPLNLNLKP